MGTHFFNSENENYEKMEIFRSFHFKTGSWIWINWPVEVI